MIYTARHIGKYMSVNLQSPTFSVIEVHANVVQQTILSQVVV